MMLGSVITASMGGFLMTKLKYRTIMLPTLVLLVIGMGLLTTLDGSSSQWTVRAFMILVGLGIGASFSVLSNAAMFSVSPRDRGTASSTLNFLRSLGMTLGITIFGILQSHVFTRKLTDAMSSLGGAAGSSGSGDGTGAAGAASGGMPPGLDLKDPHALLSPDFRKSIPPQILDAITNAMSSSIVQTFAWAVIPAVLALLISFFMGKDKLNPADQQDEYVGGH
jgi:MFS family permease